MGRMGRKPIGTTAMSGSERTRRWLERKLAAAAGAPPVQAEPQPSKPQPSKPQDAAELSKLRADLKARDVELARLRSELAMLGMENARLRAEQMNLRGELQVAMKRQGAEGGLRMPKADHRLMRSALHPDGEVPPERKAKLEAASKIFNALPIVIIEAEQRAKQERAAPYDPRVRNPDPTPEERAAAAAYAATVKAKREAAAAKAAATRKAKREATAPPEN